MNDNHDYYADLAARSTDPSAANHFSGLDVSTVSFFKNRERKTISFFCGKEPSCCGKRTEIFKPLSDELIPDELSCTTKNKVLPSPRFLWLEIAFTLKTPWYSKDDRLFHILENPVRKDRLFGVPYMSASSWKGMLRWACRMRAGLLTHLRKNNKTLNGWKDPDWIIHLFGNEKGEGEEFSQGALYFYPTFFDKIGYEVINPHSRETRAGKMPIYYEVVPLAAKGTLRMLYAPIHSPSYDGDCRKWLCRLLGAVEELLTKYGFSAKRTVGWGTAKITKWKASYGDKNTVEKDSRKDLLGVILKEWS